MIEVTAPVHAPHRTTDDAVPCVFVVDDDISIRESLELLFGSAGWRALPFACAADFLAHPHETAPSCLVLDVGLPDVHGLDVQARCASDRTTTPIVFISGHIDVPTTVRGIKAGAVEFLTKPLRGEALLSAVESALEVSHAELRRERTLAELRSRHASLTPRESQVMALVVKGLLNKQIAAELGISEITVKEHRGRMMRKMKVRRVPDLVKLAARLGLPE